jgi:hypothetical protein
VRATATGLRLAASPLLTLHQARRSWEHRRTEFLPGGPQTGRDPTVTEPDKAFPGGEISRSMPGLGDRLTARIAGEIGDHIHQYDTPHARHCYAGCAPPPAGRAPATSSSPAASHTIITWVTPYQGAFCSLTHSAWAREFYDEKITAGKSHHAALRALSNRWLEILCTA